MLAKISADNGADEHRQDHLPIPLTEDENSDINIRTHSPLESHVGHELGPSPSSASPVPVRPPNRQSSKTDTTIDANELKAENDPVASPPESDWSTTSEGETYSPGDDHVPKNPSQSSGPEAREDEGQTDRSELTSEHLRDLQTILRRFMSEIIGKFSALVSIASAISPPNISISNLYDEFGRARVWENVLIDVQFTKTNQKMYETVRVALEDFNMLVDRGISAFFSFFSEYMQL